MIFVRRKELSQAGIVIVILIFAISVIILLSDFLKVFLNYIEIYSALNMIRPSFDFNFYRSTLFFELNKINNKYEDWIAK